MASPTHQRRAGAPFVLRSLLDDVPLSEDGSQSDIKINCVDYLDGNLYVGTSASELLHFFHVAPDPTDRNSRSMFILASRLRPAYAESSGAPGAAKPGVQQILLLPRVGKACVLCNWTVTFYSLPELSPVFGNTQVKNCNWIGGVDLNEAGAVEGGEQRSHGVTVLLSLNRRIQVVRIGDDARVVKKIDFAGSTLTVRRDTIACVADSRSYSLLDVERQLKIPLMAISSLDDSQPADEMGRAQKIAGDEATGILRSSSTAQSRPLLSAPEHQSHTRSTSLGAFITGRKQEPRPGELGDPISREPTPPVRSAVSKPPGDTSDKQLPSIPPEVSASAPRPETQTARAAIGFLKPHIVSPSAEEFLLVTGTGPLEPGIGMFVNLDGDPTRPTVEFERYPRDIVVDCIPTDLASSRMSLPAENDGYVLASMAKEFHDGLHHGLEIQRLDSTDMDPEGKYWLEPNVLGEDGALKIYHAVPLGIRSLLGSEESKFDELVQKICQRRFMPFARRHTPETATLSPRSVDSRTASSMEQLSQERELFERDADAPDDEELLPAGWEEKRNADEEEFAGRLANATCRIAVWSGNSIWWAVRNPLLLQLESGFPVGQATGMEERRSISTVLNSIRSRDAKTELEFVTFSYVRQQAGLMLFTGFLNATDEHAFTETETKMMEEVLAEGSLDPRVILSLVPGLRNEIVVSQRGIWIFGGIKETVERYLQSVNFEHGAQAVSTLRPGLVDFLKRYLTSWRRKKGFGSIADEADVFRTVDAALFVVLLELDRASPKGLPKSKSVRTELYELVDNNDCFERAVGLLEIYHRLFALSRLYQSRKMSADVLGTWRRIIEGERDDGGELRDGEQRMREYLTKISSQSLVQEYGLWLATRNPKLGVQVFAEDKGKAPKFEPAQAVALLKEEAPDAVKYYLEYLVFGKGHTTYVNDLIAYYLDIVVTDLQTSQASRDRVATTYDTYRALQAPKPTYRQFLTENAPPDDEIWHSRLRLLQLLGGAHDYDAAGIRRRIASLPGDYLVPETIILDGRERNHEDALRLLVHGLGDYDTAVAYCLRGGSSIYALPDGRRESMPTREQQARLFGVVLGEFLAIADVSDRVAQTGALLERFGGWFDVEDVLNRIPDGWSVGVVAGFLVSSLRRVVQERRASVVARALSTAENLRVNGELLERIDEKGSSIEAES